MIRFFRFTKFAFWAGLFLFVNMVVLLINQGSKNYELQKKVDKLETEIVQLETENQQLGYKITYYKTDNYKEKLAREKLGLQMPGETVAIIPKSQNTQQPGYVTANGTNNTVITPSNFEQWLDFLFGS